MIIASIDIGTNTVLLLVAEVIPGKNVLKSLANKYRIPRVGKGLKPGGLISNEKINALFNVLDEYSNIIKKYNCEQILITATNAFRIASNGKEVAKQIFERFGIPVNIISGDDEAELSFLAAVSGIRKDQIAMVIDIGGGSTELIFGAKDEIKFKKSFPAGAVSGTEKYLLHDPPLKNEIEDFEKSLNEIFDNLNDFIQNPAVSIAIAGTPTTLACIQQNLNDFDEEKIEGSTLKRKDINDLINGLSDLSSQEIKNKYKSIVEGRQDVLLSGSLILYKIMDILKIDKVSVSTKGIRYGAIVDYLHRSSKD